MKNMIEEVLGDIITAFLHYGPMAAITGVLVILGIVLLSGAKDAKEIELTWENIRKYILFYIFYVYCFIMISITILSRAPGSRKTVDMQLFSTFSANVSDNIFPLENVLLFIPLGLLLPLLWEGLNHLTYVLLIGLLFSIMIEAIQFITQRGFFQTDDILLNLIGTGIGALIYYVLIQIKKRFSWERR